MHNYEMHEITYKQATQKAPAIIVEVTRRISIFTICIVGFWKNSINDHGTRISTSIVSFWDPACLQMKWHYQKCIAVIHDGLDFGLVGNTNKSKLFRLTVRIILLNNPNIYKVKMIPA